MPTVLEKRAKRFHELKTQPKRISLLAAINRFINRKVVLSDQLLRSCNGVVYMVDMSKLPELKVKVLDNRTNFGSTKPLMFSNQTLYPMLHYWGQVKVVNGNNRLMRETNIKTSRVVYPSNLLLEVTLTLPKTIPLPPRREQLRIFGADGAHEWVPDGKSRQ